MSKIKASTLCASSALLVLGGFMSINLAGCGGGGGGGNGGFGSPTATPAAQNITFRLQRQDGAASNGGTVTLTPAVGTGTLRATADTSGIATIPTVPPGVYTVSFTVVGSTGTVLSTTSSTVTITRASSQTFLLLQDQGTGSTGSFAVSGTIRLNPGVSATPSATASATPRVTATVSSTPSATATVTATPTDPRSISNCSASSEPITGSLLVEVIDLDASKGRPIIAQLRRSGADTNRGLYTIFLPYKPAAFQVRVGQFDVSGARFAGLSAASNFNGATTVGGVPTVRPLDVCVNLNGITPQFPRATATPGATATSTPRPVTTPQPGTTTQPGTTPPPVTTA
ncbi:carboxypeptidase-like regulatory domain-containing protein [Abditibacterium utsteinense]|uniref:carboxypeptidase-like regulatory domain-containing protein n=1 Tax=Abditibacterium utsteinense TaxID=1960156 RepID=UPI000F4A4056|nr:carboxypeptidase-like regulatory domain-containing protein [Abditibacterium utsteinense]